MAAESAQTGGGTQRRWCWGLEMKGGSRTPPVLPRPIGLSLHSVTCAVSVEGEDKRGPGHGHHQSCLLWLYSWAEPSLTFPSPSSSSERGRALSCKWDSQLLDPSWPLIRSLCLRTFQAGGGGELRSQLWVLRSWQSSYLWSPLNPQKWAMYAPWYQDPDMPLSDNMTRAHHRHLLPLHCFVYSPLY